MIKISKEILNKIIERANNDAPIETCGYLAAKDDEIKEIFPMKNMENSPTYFSFDPKEQFEVLKKARKNELKLLIVYHSHPDSPARPSKEDMKLAYDPDIFYLIISLVNKEPIIKIFKIAESNYNEIQYEIVDNENDKINLTLDLRNVKCPMNFVKTKLALEQIEIDQVLEILLDSDEAILNVPKSVKEEGHKIINVENLNSYYKVKIKKQ